MTSFEYICELSAVSDEYTDDIEQPERDDAQEGWLRALTFMRNRGIPVPEASSAKELIERFQEHAGIIVTKRNQAAIDGVRRRKGRPKTPTAIKRTVTLDEAIEYADPAAEDAYRAIEFSDEFDRKLRDIDPNVLQRFIAAWTLQEQGKRISPKLSAAISRDRARTGLSLELRRGRG